MLHTFWVLNDLYDTWPTFHAWMILGMAGDFWHYALYNHKSIIIIIISFFFLIIIIQKISGADSYDIDVMIGKQTNPVSASVLEYGNRYTVTCKIDPQGTKLSGQETVSLR